MVKGIGSPLREGVIRLYDVNRELVPDYETELLFAPRMEDWLGENHVARFIREFVSMQDLAALGFSREVKQTGRRPIALSVLLSAWLYAYFTKQRSTRLLERACCCDIGAIWLTGNLQPDHSTLWLFFDSYGEQFKALLKESALLACRMGLVDLRFVAIDGSKIRACVNGKGALSAEDLEIAVAALDEEIEVFAKEVEAAGDEACTKLPEALTERKALRDAMEKDLKELRELGASRISPVDPDARQMKTKGGKLFCYNGQVAVDSLSGIVLACEMSQEANDSSFLNQMIGQVEENLGMTPEVTLVDSGYFSADELKAAEDANRGVEISMRGRAPKEDDTYHSWHFEQDKERNVLTCPKDVELRHRSRCKSSHAAHELVDRYHCDVHASCPVALLCSKDLKGRVVEVGLNRDAAIRKWESQKKRPEEHKELMKLRGATVERIFGNIKRNMGLRQLDHRGLGSVTAVWNMCMCVTNLKTIAKAMGYR